MSDVSEPRFSLGDIVRVERIDRSDDDLPPTDLPTSWEAIVVDFDPEYPNRIEVAWLGRNATAAPARISPYKEMWDDSIACIETGVDATVTLLKKASYTECVA